MSTKTMIIAAIALFVLYNIWKSKQPKEPLSEVGEPGTHLGSATGSPYSGNAFIKRDRLGL